MTHNNEVDLFDSYRKSGEHMKKISKYIMLIIVIFSCIATGHLKAEETAEKRVMYLTFDDGPSEYTDQLLDLLAEHHMKVTFFLLDAEMKRYPNVVQRILDEGHAIGVHGVSHEKNSFYRGVCGPVSEMRQANETLESIIGMRTHLIRTPYGSYPYLTKQQQQALFEEEFIIWDWNVDSRDWAFRCPEKTFCYTTKMIRESKKEPKVILFHDIKYVVQTMKLFLNWMDDQNYTSQAITPDLEPVVLGKKK